MEQSVLGGWERKRMEKAKLSCPRGAGAVSGTAAPDQASEEANRDGWERVGVGVGNNRCKEGRSKCPM